MRNFQRLHGGRQGIRRGRRPGWREPVAVLRLAIPGSAFWERARYLGEDKSRWAAHLSRWLGSRTKNFSNHSLPVCRISGFPSIPARDWVNGWRDSLGAGKGWLYVIGRLKPGITSEQARAGMNVLFRQAPGSELVFTPQIQTAWNWPASRVACRDCAGRIRINCTSRWRWGGIWFCRSPAPIFSQPTAGASAGTAQRDGCPAGPHGDRAPRDSAILVRENPNGNSIYAQREVADG